MRTPSISGYSYRGRDEVFPGGPNKAFFMRRDRIFQIQGSAGAETEIWLYDVRGRIVMNKNLKPGDMFLMDGIPAGTYLGRIIRSGEERGFRIFFIQ